MIVERGYKKVVKNTAKPLPSFQLTNTLEKTQLTGTNKEIKRTKKILIKDQE